MNMFSVPITNEICDDDFGTSSATESPSKQAFSRGISVFEKQLHKRSFLKHMEVLYEKLHFRLCPCQYRIAES